MRSMSDELRRAPRVPAPHVMVKVSTRERMKSTYLKDLSEGGLFVRTDKPLPVGRELVIDLLPPGWSAPLRLSGSVTRVQAQGPLAGMGVQFDQKDVKALERLKLLAAEYQGQGAGEVATDPWAVDHERQLQQLLERFAELQNVLEQREGELKGERERREEAARRALDLACELEAVKTRGEKRTSDAPQNAQLKVELSVSQREAAELHTRVAELEGELAAYKHELEQMEADDTVSRRLAAGLGREKAELTTEVGRLSKQLAEANQRNEEIATQRAEIARLREEREHTTAALETSLRENDRFKEQLAVLAARGDELDGASNKLAEQLARASGEATTAKAEVAALERRTSQLEAAAKEANARAERQRLKERELRELLAVVSSRGDDVVVVDDPEHEPGTIEPPAPPAATPAVREEPAPPAATPLGEELAVPGAGGSSPSLVAAVTREISAAEPQLASEPAASSPSALTMDVDVDLSESEPAGRLDLEQRVRANGALKRTSLFDKHQPGNPAVADVMGLLEAGSHFSELMVLGRGKVTPGQIVEALLELLEAGALNLED